MPRSSSWPVPPESAPSSYRSPSTPSIVYQVARFKTAPHPLPGVVEVRCCDVVSCRSSALEGCHQFLQLGGVLLTQFLMELPRVCTSCAVEFILLPGREDHVNDGLLVLVSPLHPLTLSWFSWGWVVLSARARTGLSAGAPGTPRPTYSSQPVRSRRLLVRLPLLLPAPLLSSTADHR
jgi:hypothetical protein